MSNWCSPFKLYNCTGDILKLEQTNRSMLLKLFWQPGDVLGEAIGHFGGALQGGSSSIGRDSAHFADCAALGELCIGAIRTSQLGSNTLLLGGSGSNSSYIVLILFENRRSF